MRFSANLGFLYTDLPLTEAVAAAARDGFDAVEFHFPYDLPPKELARALDAAGLPGLALNTLRGDTTRGDFGLCAVPGREAEARDVIARAVDYAVEAGLGAVHVMAGKAEGEAAEETFAAALHHACDLAGPAGKRLLIEPINTRDVPGYFLTGTAQAASILARVDRPELRIMYDFYHLQIMQGDHLATIEAIRPLIGHFQIAAVPDRNEPDEGELDLAWILGRAGLRDAHVGAEYRPTRPPGEWLRGFRAALAARADGR